MIVAIDYDDTLVEVKSQDWLPGAVDALHSLLINPSVTVVIHSCRANWPEGRASIEAKLRQTFGDDAAAVQIVGKPLADYYIDDRAVRFTGWPATLNALPPVIFNRGVPLRPPRRTSPAIDPSAVAILSGWRA